jgi:hypothetical protein
MGGMFLMNNAKVAVNAVSVNHNVVIGEKNEVYYHPVSLDVECTLIFNGIMTASGTIKIHEGDQDTHESVENLTIEDIQFIVAYRLGVIRDGGYK